MLSGEPAAHLDSLVTDVPDGARNRASAHRENPQLFGSCSSKNVPFVSRGYFSDVNYRELPTNIACINLPAKKYPESQ